MEKFHDHLLARTASTPPNAPINVIGTTIRMHVTRFQPDYSGKPQRNKFVTTNARIG
jgi:hypothetical protein